MVEEPTISALVMDRPFPLGNSEDTFNRRALHTKIGNKTTEPVPILIAGFPGDDLHLPAQDTTTPGVEQTLITYTVPANKYAAVFQVYVTCRYEGRFTVLNGSDVVGSGRTGPACMNVVFPFGPLRKFETGDTLVVKFMAEDYRPAASIEAFVQGRLIAI